jgi:hypothetical protein
MTNRDGIRPLVAPTKQVRNRWSSVRRESYFARLRIGPALHITQKLLALLSASGVQSDEWASCGTTRLMWRMIINASLVASFQLLHGTELVNHFRVDSRRVAIVPTDRTSPVGSATATAIVSAWTSRPRKRTLLMTNSFRMRLCAAFAVSASQRNPRIVRNWGWSLHND